jgi:hypothetical protein
LAIDTQTLALGQIFQSQRYVFLFNQSVHLLDRLIFLAPVACLVPLLVVAPYMQTLAIWLSFMLRVSLSR